MKPAMIPRSTGDVQTAPWQRALAKAICNPAELLALLELPAELLAGSGDAIRQFPLRVPHSYAALIEKGNPSDPLLRQILPLKQELDTIPGYHADPVGDQDAVTAPGLLEKYHGRALLVTTGACAIHCRYCFRRHFPYADHKNQGAQLHTNLRKLIENGNEEVILSGGDPLSLTNSRLRRLLDELAGLPQIKRIRLHSRYPTVLPERIDQDFIALSARFPGRPIMVIQCNHPRELGEQACAALAKLRQADWVLYNQAVLLQGVNDKAETLIELSEALFELGVQPYYLHWLDPVQGAAHFNVPLETARYLHQQLRAKLPGYLVPRLVREIPGEIAKTPI